MGTVVPWLWIYYCFVMKLTFSMLLSEAKLADIIDAFNTTSGYLDDILNIYNVHIFYFNLIKQIPLIPKPRFWTCIFVILMILFLPKFTINVRIYILKL